MRRTELTYQISPICPQLNETNSVNISDITNMSTIKSDGQCYYIRYQQYVRN